MSPEDRENLTVMLCNALVHAREAGAETTVDLASGVLDYMDGLGYLVRRYFTLKDGDEKVRVDPDSVTRWANIGRWVEHNVDLPCWTIGEDKMLTFAFHDGWYAALRRAAAGGVGETP